MLCGLDTPLLDYELEQPGGASASSVPHAISSNPTALPMRYISVAPRIESERSGERTPTARGRALKKRLDSQEETEQNRPRQVELKIKFILNLRVHPVHTVLFNVFIQSHNPYYMY